LLDEEYNNFILLADKTNKKAKTIFGVYSYGVTTARDAWVYNFSKKSLQNNMEKTIEFYNMEVNRWEDIIKSDGSTDVGNFVKNDKTKISWGMGLKNSIKKHKKLEFKKEDVILGIYRPFVKEYLYFNKDWNDGQYQLNKMFPKNLLKGGKENILFGIVSERKGVSSFITDKTVDFACVEKAKYFSLYSYEKDGGLFGDVGEEVKYKRVENVTDFALKHFREYFKNTKITTKQITKEEIFYYCFGMLNNEKYLAKYKNYLSKEMGRVPLVENEELFFEFASLGKKLADIILNYENYKHNKDLIVEIDDVKVDELFKVNKMKFLNKEIKDTIIYNDYIRVKNIPKEAYNYIINGKSGINWVMDRYSIKQDKDSGIINNPNLFAKENLDDKYILNLLLSVISLSVDVVKIKAEIENLVDF
jgi:predicted helicase